jgi:hypothetical protein
MASLLFHENNMLSGLQFNIIPKEEMKSYIADKHVVDLPKQVLIFGILREGSEEIELVFPRLTHDTLW